MRKISFRRLFTLTFLFLFSFEVMAAPNSVQNKNANVRVLIETSEGSIKLELYPDKAPVSVKNFLSYVNEGAYDGTIFHRVISGFMIQGGGFTPDWDKRPTHSPIINEADNGLKNRRGTLAMARTNHVDSATSQFFINLSDNSFLDHSAKGFGYAVFGEVSEGMNVVQAIAKVRTARKVGRNDVPVTDIVMTKVSLIQ